MRIIIEKTTKSPLQALDGDQLAVESGCRPFVDKHHLDGYTMENEMVEGPKPERCL
jgi:hypothetical protein